MAFFFLKLISKSTTIFGFISIQAHDRGLHPKGSINCAGYKVLKSMEKYLELLDTSLPGKTLERRKIPLTICACLLAMLLSALTSRETDGILKIGTPTSDQGKVT